MTDCLFCKFVTGEIQPNVVYEDDEVLAFRDVNPQAPTHVL
ncbi:MAG: HIT domain-containing protein, partial [Chromatiales bacterium]